MNVAVNASLAALVDPVVSFEPSGMSVGLVQGDLDRLVRRTEVAGEMGSDD